LSFLIQQGLIGLFNQFFLCPCCFSIAQCWPCCLVSPVPLSSWNSQGRIGSFWVAWLSEFLNSTGLKHYASCCNRNVGILPWEFWVIHAHTHAHTQWVLANERQYE
jgi:hypothetical protein